MSNSQSIFTPAVLHHHKERRRNWLKLHSKPKKEDGPLAKRTKNKNKHKFRLFKESKIFPCERHPTRGKIVLKCLLFFQHSSLDTTLLGFSPTSPAVPPQVCFAGSSSSTYLSLIHRGLCTTSYLFTLNSLLVLLQTHS